MSGSNSFLIVASSKDEAGFAIAEHLIANYSFSEVGESFEGHEIYSRDDLGLVITEREIVFADHLDRYFKPKAYIFVSKHRAASGIPSLTTHFPGNFSEDISFGGRAKELSYTFPSLLKAYFQKLWSIREEASKYKMVLEVMHHGPTSLRRPVLFIEIGSTEREWCDETAVSTVSSALMNFISIIRPAEKIGIGFGGTHYPEKFSRMLVETEFAFGSIAPRYVLQSVNRQIVDQMIGKCVEKVRYAVLDWKGLGQEKSKILSILNETDLEIIKV